MNEFLYEITQFNKMVFGDHFCGSERLEHATETLIAQYPKDPPDGDGQSVEVWCEACPARFYRLVVAAEPNSLGKPQKAFSLQTGSGDKCAKLAAAMAEAISIGMLGLSEGGTSNED